MSEEKVLDWLKRIGTQAYSENILCHIQKHIQEFQNKEIEKWIDSMLNLLFIYRFNQNKEFLNYEGMLERLINRKNKNIKGDIE